MGKNEVQSQAPAEVAQLADDASSDSTVSRSEIFTNFDPDSNLHYVAEVDGHDILVAGRNIVIGPGEDKFVPTGVNVVLGGVIGVSINPIIDDIGIKVGPYINSMLHLYIRNPTSEEITIEEGRAICILEAVIPQDLDDIDEVDTS